jgi:hypothetical protein
VRIHIRRLRPGKLAGGPGFRESAPAIATFAFRSDKPTGEAAFGFEYHPPSGLAPLKKKILFFCFFFLESGRTSVRSDSDHPKASLKPTKQP